MWDLNSLYEGFNSRQFMSDSAALMRLSMELNKFDARLTAETEEEAVQIIEAYLEALERYEGLAQKLLSYADFRFSAATNDGEAALSVTRFREIEASTARVRVRFSAFLSREENQRLVESGRFGAYTYYLKDLLRRQRHVLSPEQESMLSLLTLTGSQAWSSFHAKAVAAPQREQPSEPEGCTVAEISAAALNAIKGEALAVCRLRGYDDPLEETLSRWHFDRRILENQMAAVEEYLPRLRSYFAYKGKRLGYSDGLPYGERERLMLRSQRQFSFDEARHVILEAFGAFSPKMERFGRRFFENNWIDSEPRAFKEAGASCDAVWLAGESRIRMHYRGTVGDANALAHELGHGYHFENLFGQKQLNCRYDLPVAESASKFSEMLFKEQLRRTLPEEEQLFCEEFMLSSCINTIVDISARFSFEQELFRYRKDGDLPVEEIDELMAAAQRKSYGDALDPDRLEPRAWVAKPHYYNAKRNFYNFPYQFGTLLSIQMLEQWNREPREFAQAYDHFLSATGRCDVLELCGILGMDPLDPEFFRAPLQSLADRLGRFLCVLDARQVP